jgi:hypothetical protein
MGQGVACREALGVLGVLKQPTNFVETYTKNDSAAWRFGSTAAAQPLGHQPPSPAPFNLG